MKTYLFITGAVITYVTIALIVMRRWLKEDAELGNSSV